MTGLPIQNPKWLRRDYATFERLISAAKHPVVLLEGSRDVPRPVQQHMEALSARLMRTFSKLIARSGNAEGSDQAWARGVNAVDPKRLQLVLPVPNYKGAVIDSDNEVMTLQEAPPEDFYSARTLTRANYVYGDRRGAEAYDGLPPFKQTYLDRDALKVLGTTDYRGGRMKATAALFYINPAKKNGGGTGHTLRLCEAEKVAYFLSDDWMTWVT